MIQKLHFAKMFANIFWWGNLMQNIVLVGNPNVGKTTLFNVLTKSSEHTGNWHGVTVADKQKTIVFNNQQIGIVDLPGIYSLTPFTLEEEVSVNYAYSHLQDLYVCIADIKNLSKNLCLAYELIFAGLNVIIVIISGLCKSCHVRW